MISRKKIGNFLKFAIVSSISLSTTGCGGSGDLITITPSDYQQLLLASRANMADDTKDDNSCCCSCQNGSSGNNSGSTTNNSSNSGNTSTGTDTSTNTGGGTTSTPSTDTGTGSGTTTTDSNTSTNNDDKGRKILDKIMSQILKANGYEVVVDKSEKNLETGEVIENGIHLFARKPNEVKLELTRHSKNPGNAGTKIKYTTGASKVKVRPTGALSLVTADLDMTDDRVTSPNQYTPDKTDVFGLSKRLYDQSYSAEVSGKTKIGGKDVYILKIKKKSGTNELDSRITYEHIGFDPNDFTVRLWEAFTDADKEPFLRMVIQTFNLLDSVSDSQMKI